LQMTGIAPLRALDVDLVARELGNGERPAAADLPIRDWPTDCEC